MASNPAYEEVDLDIAYVNMEKSCVVLDSGEELAILSFINDDNEAVHPDDATQCVTTPDDTGQVYIIQLDRDPLVFN